MDEIPDSQLREVLARERKKNSILADENNGLMEKLKKAKVYILNQNEQIKDLREGGAGVAKVSSIGLSIAADLARF